MSKVYENFELKLMSWGQALREYNEAYAQFQADMSVNNESRVDAAARRLDRLRGPMHTALDRLAKEVC